VALTEAGEQLQERLKPALTEVGETLDQISRQRNKAAGRIRLLLPRLAVSSVLAPKLGTLNTKYPDIVLDVTTDDSRRDIVADGFDAGIRFGEYIEKDMIAVRVSPDHRPAIVGSPEYFNSHSKPKEPRDLLQHQCINFRHGAAGLDGVGLGFVEESEVAGYVAEGRLLRVLQDWCQPYPGFFIYYPSRRKQTAALSALISVLRI
jgi:DNA-binding transcriptional LysR family regulator